MFNLASRTRPYFGALVLTTALLSAAGIYCAYHMASSVYPEITFSRISIVARKPGLDLRGMELQVTLPLEQAVSTVLGVTRVRSQTIRGSTEISVEFAPGSDMRRAEQLAWNRIGAVRSSMPADVEFVVEQMTPSAFPILSVVLTGGDSPAQLRDYAYFQLAPRIKNLPDVHYANVSGGDLREIIVEVRPDDLLAAGMSAADLADEIGKRHRLQPVGRIEQPPFAYQILIDTQGETARSIEDLIIPAKNGQSIRVGQVANVKIGHEDRVRSVGFEGEDAVVVTVFRQLGGNTVNISNAIQELLKKENPPHNVKVQMGYDEARFVTSSVHNVRDAILIGGVFSILILLGFLRSWRATLISALAIPVTLCITFLFLYLWGETLNLMSLGGLAVAIGLIIDDTVVVIENIARHLGKTGGGSRVAGRGEDPHAVVPPPATHHPPPDPVDLASGEITGAVVGSTLTTVLVFLPLAFIAGVYGKFFASLSLALAIAVLVSMVISLTIIPVFAARFLAGRPMPEPGLIFRAVSFLYEMVLRVALRFPWVTLGASLAIVGVGVLLFTGIPDMRAVREKDKPLPKPWVAGLETGLMPEMDEGAFILDYFAPTGTPLKSTEEIAHKLEKVLSENPDVETYVRRTGAELGPSNAKTSRGDIQVALRPAEEDPLSLLLKPVRPPFKEIEAELKKIGKEGIRKKYRRRPVTKVRDEVEDEIKDLFSKNQLIFETIPIMEDELNDLSGANRPIEIKLFGPDHVQLRKLAEAVAETLSTEGEDKHRGIKEVKSNVWQGVPELSIQVDGARANAYNLSATEVERQARAIYFGQLATQVPESALRMTDVVVRYPDAYRYGVGSFDLELVRNQLILAPEGTGKSQATPFRPLAGLGRAIPLSALATITPRRTPDERSRENQQPAIFVTAELVPSEAGLSSVVADIRGWMARMEQKNEIPAGYRWELGGHYIRMQEAFQSLTFVMAVAILLVYIMLVVQFKSVVLPLLIFLTQPLSLVSGLFALWLTDTPLNVSSYMGAILLIGLDMKNGILLVEYIQQLRSEGMELREALIVAGRTRFRPILMTSLAAILGLFPLALGIGPGSQMQQPLAIMVIGGLTANMLFTRMVIPVGYLVLERKKAAKT